MNNVKAGIVIVTRNRQALLSRCVKAVSSQIVKSDNIYIIDNNSDAKHIIKGVQIDNIFLKSNSLAKSRNIGFNLCKKNGNDLCVYIDDDCLPKNNWLKQIKASHTSDKCVVAISGKVVNPDPNNIYGTIHNELSRAWLIKSNSVDTKNVSIKTKYIKDLQPFDDKREVYKREDTLFSDYLHERNLRIRYSERIIVSHQEKDNLREYLKKRVAIANTSDATKNALLFEPYKAKFRMSILEELPIILKIITSEFRCLRIANIFKTITLCILMILIKMNAKLSLNKK